MSRKVVTIGGGAGQSRVLAGLKRVKELKDLEVTSIVTAADSGGSSGRLRDEFGVHPWGDILRCIVGLSDAPEDLRELFLYRFPGTGDLGQHTVGNIILTALNQLKGSPLEAVLALCHLLHVREMVLPVTEASVSFVPASKMAPLSAVSITSMLPSMIHTSTSKRSGWNPKIVPLFRGSCWPSPPPTSSSSGPVISIPAFCRISWCPVWPRRSVRRAPRKCSCAA